MGFQDTFTRDSGSESNLQYDDTAFYYFFVGVLISIAIPLAISLIKPIISNPVKQKLKNVPNCKFDQEKARQLYQKNKNNFFNNSYKIKLVVLLVILLFIKKTYQAIDTDKQTLKRFDAWEILDVPHGSEKQVIKKAYRKLSLKYHPDKNKNDPEAKSKFIMVGKAYECLTDEKKKDLCEKYGNPDGPGKLSVAIAMPSFLLKKENHVGVLFIFFFILLVVLPGIGFYWYKNLGLKNEHGVLLSNRKGFYQRLNEALIMKNCPEVIALCDEFSKYPVNQQQMEDLARLLKNLDPDFNLKKLPEQERQRFATPYVIICAHLQGLQIPTSLQDYYYQIMVTSPQIIQSMISFIMSHPFFHRKVPAEQRGNLKFFGVDPMLRLIDFQQNLVQGLWINSEKYPDILQLSYFKEHPSERRNKKLPKLVDLIRQSREERKLNFLLEEEHRDKVNDEIDILPNIDIDIFCGVEGEDVICDIDQVEVKTTITRKQLKDKQPNPLIHAVNNPTFRNEKWHVIIASERKDVIDYQVLQGEQKTLSCKFQTRFPPGRFKLILHVKSDCYKGYDVEKELFITVKSQHEVDRKVEWHEEDKDLDKDLSLFGQMMQQMNPQNEDSDEEEEEEEETKETQQKPRATLGQPCCN